MGDLRALYRHGCYRSDCRASSILGAKRTYLAGLGLIAAGAIHGSLAQSLGWLIAARILLGIGTATQYPNAMTVVRRYADQHNAQTRSAIATLTICAQSVVAVSAILFTLWERRTATPFIDVRAVAANHALSMTLSRTLLTYTPFYCIFFGLPQGYRSPAASRPQTPASSCFPSPP